MKNLIHIFILFYFTAYTQTFTHSGYVYNANEIGIPNIPVKVYKRTTPNLQGFTQQTNYNGHSYYRSIYTDSWLGAKAACEAMNGHLVTMGSQAENDFVFNTWPSGWIGFYQNKNLPSYSEPYGAWVWVDNTPVTYTKWNGGEPNDAGGEDYAQFVGGGFWNDLPSGVWLNYVLEFDYIVTTSSWSLVTTVVTNAQGQYNINLPTNPSIEWYLEIGGLVLPSLTANDVQNVLNTIITNSVNAKKYYLQDVNNDSKITISDAYYINGMISGRFGTWLNPTPSYRMFNPIEWNTIKNSNANLKTTYPGTQTITVNSPVSGGTTNIYLLRTGFAQ